MTPNHEKILDTLTPEQRQAIAHVIRSADVVGGYRWNGEESVWEEDASATLQSLATFFENYDPESIHN